MLPVKERFASIVSTVEIRGMSESGDDSTSNPPRSQESFSIFDDTACGEPLHAQRLIIDFTPVEDMDNDYVQRKCCAFWDFMKSRTNLHHMIVMPEKNVYEVSKTNELLPSIPKEPEEIDLTLQKPTAMSMLELVEGKGLIDRTFEAKLPQSKCSLGSREYQEDTFTLRTKTDQNKIKACPCKGECKTCVRKSAQKLPAVPESSPEVQILCGKMKAWDRDHPKSLDPPGHPPALSRCIMQRKVPT